MLFWKAWRETRSKLLYSILFMLFFSTFIVLAVSHEPAQKQTETAFWNAYSFAVGLGWLFFVTMLAGAGIDTQVFASGRYSGAHPSMLFTLSMPVRRQDLVLSRSLTGAVLAGAVALIPLSVVLAASHSFLPVQVSLRTGLVVSLTMFAAGMILYWLNVVLSVFFDQQTQTFAGMTAACVVFVGGTFLHVPIAKWFADLMMSTSWHEHHVIPWNSLAICLVLSIALLTFAIKAAERREY